MLLEVRASRFEMSASGEIAAIRKKSNGDFRIEKYDFFKATEWQNDDDGKNQ